MESNYFIEVLKKKKKNTGNKQECFMFEINYQMEETNIELFHKENEFGA